jgi:hypothetical protein
MNGNIASNSVRVIDGKAYVPLADIAKAQGMVVVPIDGGYEIKKAGGATPIKGLQGKVGDVLFDGKWRFQVLSVQAADSYQMKTQGGGDYAVYRDLAEFELPARVYRPKPGYTLIVMQCRVTNARNSNQALWVFNAETHTALADMDGESHPPIGFDFAGAPLQSKELLPGAKLDFALLFSVPEDTKLKDLVFTLRNIGEKGTDVRVSLRGANTGEATTEETE